MFNKETEYALRSLVYIQVENDKGRRPGLSEIAGEIDAPPFYTAKILQRMVRQGFVQSRKGRGGGFFFDSRQTPLRIGDVIKAVEGDNLMTSCAFGLKHCDENNPCPLHTRYAPIRETINALVREETIQSLARREEGQ